MAVLTADPEANGSAVKRACLPDGTRGRRCALATMLCGCHVKTTIPTIQPVICEGRHWLLDLVLAHWLPGSERMLGFAGRLRGYAN